jgi:hypothetical protein
MNTKTAIHADDVSNVKIISRVLLECGKLQGGEGFKESYAVRMQTFELLDKYCFLTN